VAQHANDYQSLLWLVSVEAGITIAASGLQSLQREGMVWRPIKDAGREAQMLMICRRDNESPSLRMFQRTVLAGAKEEGDNGREGDGATGISKRF
jgi:hypothetical protein